MKNWKPMFWTAVGLVNAGIIGYELGEGIPLGAWWWAGLIAVIVWPFIVRAEFQMNNVTEKR